MATPLPPEFGLSRYLAWRLLPSTLAIGALISVTLPLTYYFLEVARLKQAAAIFAGEIAGNVGDIAGEAPSLWKYQTYKYMKIINEHAPYRNSALIRVLDEKGRLVTESVHAGDSGGSGRTGKPAMGRAAVVLNNRPIGTVEVGMSQTPVVRKAFLIFFFSLIAGSGLAAFTYVFPLRVVRNADKAIRMSHEALEFKVEERTRELALANEALTLENEERRRTEEQLIKTREELVRKEKLFVLGELASSVGHELRNPLGVMSNAVYYLKTVLPGADDTVQEYLDIIQGEIAASERIIADLQDFAATKAPETRSTAVHQLIQRCLERCPVPKNVALQVDIPEALAAVKVDPAQIGQVFENLVTNGIQAMPGGGRLTIRAREGQEPAAVAVSITDSGEGIPPENMARLFEPLFTTKARGIGLGLPVSRKVVEAHGGRIEVESELGKGSTFRVILPAAAAPGGCTDV